MNLYSGKPFFISNANAKATCMFHFSYPSYFRINVLVSKSSGEMRSAPQEGVKCTQYDTAGMILKGRIRSR